MNTYPKPLMRTRAGPGAASLRPAHWLLLGVILLGGCAGEQVHSTTHIQALKLTAAELNQSGIAFITPSTITGQEEDKQSLALTFSDVLRQDRPKMKSITLPQTLSAINRAGLSDEYQEMFETYRATGLFDREVLRKVGELTGTRYLAQLKLEGFKQVSKDRWGILGLRIVETQSTSARVFMQIWDSNDGSIAWEGSQELNLANDTMSEKPITFRAVIEATAHNLIARLP